MLRPALALAVALGRPVVLRDIRRPPARTVAAAPHQAAGLRADIAIEGDAAALGPRTVLLLGVPGRAGFSALGRRGLPAERVADVEIMPETARPGYVSSGTLTPHPGRSHHV